MQPGCHVRSASRVESALEFATNHLAERVLYDIKLTWPMNYHVTLPTSTPTGLFKLNTHHPQLFLVVLGGRCLMDIAEF